MHRCVASCKEKLPRATELLPNDSLNPCNLKETNGVGVKTVSTAGSI